jgi:hypothetical protein
MALAFAAACAPEIAAGNWRRQPETENSQQKQAASLAIWCRSLSRRDWAEKTQITRENGAADGYSLTYSLSP